MTDITVCIPAYNCEDYIERSINSILKQTVSATVEILICDDGSTDDTIDKVKTLQTKYRSIRLIRNDTNRGRPFTRNHLVREAKGRYLTWLDADDEKYPDMLAYQFAALEKMRFEEGESKLEGKLYFTNFHWIWPSMDTPKLITPPQSEYHMETLLDASFGGYLWLMMGTRKTFQTVGKFDENLPRLQDLDFFIRFVQKGGVFHRIESEESQCIYYKDDRARGAWAVWSSWNWIWKKHKLLFFSYGYDNAEKWRRHHYRVARRFALADDDRKTYYRIAAQEVLFILRHKFRRLTKI